MPTINHYQTTGQNLYVKPADSLADPWDSDAVTLAEVSPGVYQWDATDGTSWTVYLREGTNPVATDPVAGQYTPAVTPESVAAAVHGHPTSVTRDAAIAVLTAASDERFNFLLTQQKTTPNAFFDNVSIRDAAVGEEWTIEYSGPGVSIPATTATVDANGLLGGPQWPGNSALPTDAGATYIDSRGEARLHLEYKGLTSVGTATSSSTGTTIVYALHGDIPLAEMVDRPLLVYLADGNTAAAKVVTATATTLTVSKDMIVNQGDRLYLGPAPYDGSQ